MFVCTAPFVPAVRAQVNKYFASADLVIYANCNYVAMDGGYKSYATGLVSGSAASCFSTVTTHDIAMSVAMDAGRKSYATGLVRCRVLATRIAALAISPDCNRGCQALLSPLARGEWCRCIKTSLRHNQAVAMRMKGLSLSLGLGLSGAGALQQLQTA